MKSKFFGTVAAAASVLVCGSSFADNSANDMNALNVSGAVEVTTGCNYSDYMLRLTNHGYHAQSCKVSCKHIVSRDNFSVFLHPHQSVNLYGTHGSAHCTMTCTDQYYGDITTSNFNPSC